MSIKEIIQQLRVTMDDAKGQDSHFDSWLTQNEGICKAIDALKILDTQPVAQRKPLTHIQAKELVAKYGYDLLKLVFQTEAAHGITVPKAEPVGEVTEVSDNGFQCEFNRRLAVGTKLYTTPPAVERPWVALTNEDWEQIHDKKDTALDTFQQGAVWAVDQLREKNHG